MTEQRITRRAVLGGTATAGIAVLAGCTGDEDGNGDGNSDGNGDGNGSGNGDGNGSGNGDGNGGSDPVSLSVAIPGSDTTSGQASQAFQRVVQDESDLIRWNNQETGGDPASLRQHEQGQVEALTSGNFPFTQAMNDQGPFAENPIETLPHQGFQFATLHLYWLALEGSGVETTDDLTDANVWPLPPAWGLRQLTEEVMGTAGMWEEMEPNVVQADTGDVAGRVDEGDVDALVGYGSNYVNLPGWLTEVDARAELQVVEVTDEFRTAIDDAQGTSSEEIEPYGWEQDVGDSVVSFPSGFQFHLSPSLSEEIGYEVARISHEHYEDIREGQPSYLDHSDFDNMTGAYIDDHPVHPGVANFLEENDAWDDSLERGEVS